MNSCTKTKRFAQKLLFVPIWGLKKLNTTDLSSPMQQIITFDSHSKQNTQVIESVKKFLELAPTLETENALPIIIFQDGVNDAYYAKFSLLATTAAKLCDLNAKLDFSKDESYRANRNLLFTNNAYLKMESDAKNGREFNDIIVEYNTEYEPKKPLKVWGGQHRTSAITQAANQSNHYHGFRIFFNLSKIQRTEVALISNTNIAVSNDTFDRMVEETIVGDNLRKWCQQVGLLDSKEDFPDSGSKSEKITVKRARSFIVNFYLGLEKGKHIATKDLDSYVYEPYLADTGVNIDVKYKEIIDEHDILQDAELLRAGQKFQALHRAQYNAIMKFPKLKAKKPYRNKAMIESVLCGWSYIAGLLQSHPERLENHYRIPKTNATVVDPLNANEMAIFKHELDKPTYRGLGTRSALMDRQRIAQLFLAKSQQKDVLLNKTFITKAINTLMGLLVLSKGYTKQ